MWTKKLVANIFSNIGEMFYSVLLCSFLLVCFLSRFLLLWFWSKNLCTKSLLLKCNIQNSMEMLVAPNTKTYFAIRILNLLNTILIISGPTTKSAALPTLSIFRGHRQRGWNKSWPRQTWVNKPDSLSTGLRVTIFDFFGLTGFEVSGSTRALELMSIYNTMYPM